jgi:hypothetical protein
MALNKTITGLHYCHATNEVVISVHLLNRLIHNFYLENAVESTTSAGTDSSSLFDDFSPHRKGDTASVKNHQKDSRNPHISPSRYNSTAFSRLKRKENMEEA